MEVSGWGGRDSGGVWLERRGEGETVEVSGYRMLGACCGTCAARRVLGGCLEDAGGFHSGHQWLQWCCPPSQPWWH